MITKSKVGRVCWNLAIIYRNFLPCLNLLTQLTKLIWYLFMWKGRRELTFLFLTVFIYLLSFDMLLRQHFYFSLLLITSIYFSPSHFLYLSITTQLIFSISLMMLLHIIHHYLFDPYHFLHFSITLCPTMTSKIMSFLPYSYPPYPLLTHTLPSI